MKKRYSGKGMLSLMGVPLLPRSSVTIIPSFHLRSPRAYPRFSLTHQRRSSCASNHVLYCTIAAISARHATRSWQRSPGPFPRFRTRTSIFIHRRSHRLRISRLCSGAFFESSKPLMLQYPTSGIRAGTRRTERVPGAQ